MKINVICPFCKREREAISYDIKKTGHTYCSGCAKRIKNYSYLVGQKVGRLTVLGFAEYNQSAEVNYTSMRVVCDCGTEKTVQAQFLKSGMTTSCGCLNREITSSKVGELNPNFNHNLSEEERIKRRNNYTKSWASAVKKRDGYTCQVCGSTEKLVAHHLNSYKDNPDARYDIDNGVAVCRDCHTEFHVGFMGNFSTPCTRENFNEYLLQV